MNWDLLEKRSGGTSPQPPPALRVQRGIHGVSVCCQGLPTSLPSCRGLCGNPTGPELGDRTMCTKNFMNFSTRSSRIPILLHLSTLNSRVPPQTAWLRSSSFFLALLHPSGRGAMCTWHLPSAILPEVSSGMAWVGVLPAQLTQASVSLKFSSWRVLWVWIVHWRSLLWAIDRIWVARAKISSSHCLKRFQVWSL